MKLVIAIVHDEDAHGLIDHLNKSTFSVTRLASTGGFLKAGNTTLLIGTPADKVPEVIKIIEENCKTRKDVITASSILGESGSFISMPLEVTVGGATLFVVDVEQFLRC